MPKTIFVGILLTMLVWSPVRADADGDGVHPSGNLLVNGSCEMLDEGTDHPVGWVGGHSKHTSWLVVPDGDNYCYTLGSEGGMWQDIAVKQGYRYELSFWSGTHQVWNQVVELQYVTSKGTSDANTLIESATHSITHVVDDDGRLGGQYRLTLPPAPVEASFIRVWVYADNDWAKVDALDLREWEDVPSSDEIVPEPKQHKLFLPTLML